jgi:hypothetical protein
LSPSNIIDATNVIGQIRTHFSETRKVSEYLLTIKYGNIVIPYEKTFLLKYWSSSKKKEQYYKLQEQSEWIKATHPKVKKLSEALQEFFYQ